MRGWVRDSEGRGGYGEGREAKVRGWELILMQQCGFCVFHGMAQT